ncbi:unnamed protein product [Allacma fusca]|uniref:Uncharacterized protein n=1 Tax=Allacma fusca TaxID=39272 RepID=A0A8J2KUW4_9HEXA|nr:unnamed protein product [Allacma fusca]
MFGNSRKLFLRLKSSVSEDKGLEIFGGPLYLPRYCLHFEVNIEKVGRNADSYEDGGDMEDDYTLSLWP